MLRRLLGLAGVLVVVGAVGATVATLSRGNLDIRKNAQVVGKPNIVFILTDDMDLKQIDFMPNVKALLTEKGITFSNFIINNPICCPSRATTLRGQYTRHTGVFTNILPFGGFNKAHDSGVENSTIATWLKDSGYKTVLLGKYLNGYPDTSNPTYIPPGWSEWFGLTEPNRYLNYSLNENGSVVYYSAGTAQNYLTDVLANKAVDFIQRTTSDQPFFVYLAPFAPHQPADPAPRDREAFADLALHRPPSFDETDVSDKPNFIKNLPLMSSDTISKIDSLYKRRTQSLLALDQMVGRVVQTLQDKGKLENTYIFFSSDNGFHLGEHRMPEGKASAYEEDIHLPLMVRGPGVPANQTRDHLVSNIDFAPTIAEIAGVIPGNGIDGKSFVNVMGGSPPDSNGWRSAILIEHWLGPEIQSYLGGNNDITAAGGTASGDTEGAEESAFNYVTIPTFRGVRTKDHAYIEYSTGEKELYDIKSDPYELTNIYSTADEALKLDLQVNLNALWNAEPVLPMPFPTPSSAPLSSPSTHVTTYYVDSTNGNDANSGTAMGAPWKTISKVNSSAFAAGDSVLLKRGGMWREQLVVPSSGIAGSPITFGAYGEGDKPILDGTKPISGWAQNPVSQLNPPSTSNEGSDDGYWNLEEFHNGNTWLYAGVSRTSPTHSFIRFQRISVPQGARITSASIQMVSAAMDNVTGTASTIRAVAEDNASAPSSIGDADSRVLTSSLVEWAVPDNLTALSSQTTPDIKNIVQEIVNRPGWMSGNSMAFYFTSAGTNYRYHTFFSQEDERRIPVLSISYAPSVSPIYYATVAYNPHLVFQDGRPLLLAKSLETLTGGSYFYDPAMSRLYIWTPDGLDPASHVIEASYYPTKWLDGLIQLANKSHIIIDNINIRKTNNYGVMFVGGSDITVQNSNFEFSYKDDIVSSEQKGDPHPDHIYILNNTMDTNGIYRTRSNGAESTGINIVGWQTGRVHGNTIVNQFGEGIQTQGGASDVEISNNTVINSHVVGIYISAGYVDGGDTKNFVVKNNKVIGARINQYQFGLETTYNIDGVQFYNNIADGTKVQEGGAGLRFGFYSQKGGVVKNVSVFNNTFYNSTHGIVAYGPAIDTSNTFRNNIVVSRGPAWELIDNNEANYDPDYNLLFGTPAVRWKGVDYATLSNFQSAKGKMMHSLDQDPKLKNPAAGDFSLDSRSAAIDVGVDAGSTSDYFGSPVPYGQKPDIGAVEWRGSSQPIVDINSDGRVNILDYTLLFENFGKSTPNITNPRVDINGDGRVNILDYTLLFEHFGESV